MSDVPRIVGESIFLFLENNGIYKGSPVSSFETLAGELDTKGTGGTSVYCSSQVYRL